MIQLKPCAFCGMNNIAVLKGVEHRGVLRVLRVEKGIPYSLRCDDCGASGPIAYLDFDTEDLPILNEPALLWNKRAEA